MPRAERSFVLDVSEPTGLMYLNGAIMNSPRAYAYFVRRAPKMLFAARATEGCLQAKAALVSPREFVIYSYWRGAESLRSFYTSPFHVALMKTVFEHPDWFTLYNETYAIPVSARYWNERNGYALTQPAKAETIEDFYDRTGANAQVAGRHGASA